MRRPRGFDVRRTDPVVSARTVTQPWENTRKRVSQGGEYPWSVTLKRGCIAETVTVWRREEADALVAEAAAAGFAVLGDGAVAA